VATGFFLLPSPLGPSPSPAALLSTGGPDSFTRNKRGFPLGGSGGRLGELTARSELRRRDRLTAGELANGAGTVARDGSTKNL
jgi:hypothetical protein